jgi:hypothetical protein
MKRKVNLKTLLLTSMLILLTLNKCAFRVD